jgi:hypothetical protein
MPDAEPIGDAIGRAVADAIFDACLAESDPFITGLDAYVISVLYPIPDTYTAA